MDFRGDGMISGYEGLRHDVDGGDELGRRAALLIAFWWLTLIRPVNDKVLVEGTIVEPVFSAEEGFAMIRVAEDDGVLGELFLLQPGENFTDVAVEVLDGFEVVGPSLPGNRMIGVVRREIDGGRVDGMLFILAERAVSHGKVELGVERFVRCEVGEFFGVPGFSLEVEVPIVLPAGADVFLIHNVGRAVAVISEEMRKRGDTLGESCAEFRRRPHGDGADGWLIHPGDHGCAIGHADGGGAEAVGKAHSTGCQRIDVWRVNLCSPAAEVGTHVLRDDGDNVGPVGGKGKTGGDS